jgi:hypothetical protein
MRTVVGNNKLICLNCNGEYILHLPIALGVFIKKMKAFNVLHGDCENFEENKKKKNENTRA